MGFAGAGAAAMAFAEHASKEPCLGDFDCGGSESSILDCSSRKGDDVFCAPEEAVIVKCAGEGDTTRRMAEAYSSDAHHPSSPSATHFFLPCTCQVALQRKSSSRPDKLATTSLPRPTHRMHGPAPETRQSVAD